MYNELNNIKYDILNKYLKSKNKNTFLVFLMSNNIILPSLNFKPNMATS
jgi:hypothetical protein